MQVLSAGIDTWSVGWYLRPDSPAEKAIGALATGRSRRFNVLPVEVLDHKVLWDPTHRLLAAEGHPDPSGLCPVRSDALLRVQEAIADGLRDLGVEVPRSTSPFDRTGSPGAAGVRRLDLAVDLEGDARDGSALLSGVGQVEPPGQLRSVVHRAQRGRAVETVSWQGSRGKVGRVYDKGVEQLSHRPGERVRFEDQRRWPAGARPLAEDLCADYAAILFDWRFGALRKATKGVVVGSKGTCIEQLRDLVEDGTITAAEAVRAAGFLSLEAFDIELPMSRMTRWRYRELVRRTGVVVDDSITEGDVLIELDKLIAPVFEVDWSADDEVHPDQLEIA